MRMFKILGHVSLDYPMPADLIPGLVDEASCQWYPCLLFFLLFQVRLVDGTAILGIEFVFIVLSFGAKTAFELFLDSQRTTVQQSTRVETINSVISLALALLAVSVHDD